MAAVLSFNLCCFNCSSPLPAVLSQPCKLCSLRLRGEEMLRRRLCQALGTALGQKSREKRPHAVYEVQSLGLNSFSLPLSPPHSSVRPQRHHIISASAAFQYRLEVGVSHLLQEPGQSSYILCLCFFVAIPLLGLGATLCPSSPPSRALGKYRSPSNLHSGRGKRKCLS